MDVHFRLDDGHESRREDLRRHLELLADDRLDPGVIGLVDDGAHLRAEDAFGHGLLEQRREPRHGFHQLCAVILTGQSVIHFHERHHALVVPQIIRRWLAFNVPVHGAFEQNRPENAVAVEAGRGDDAGAHLMDQREHLFIVGPRTFLDAVGGERLGRAAAALVQRGQKAGLRLDLPLLLFFAVHSAPFRLR